MSSLVWIGIFICVCHSAMFSGLNLAFFSLSRLRLEAEAAAGNKAATSVLSMRRDSNFLLTTILWGNVGINVLLTLLSNSVMAGVAAFMFSTIIITFLGEIIPQAYFSRRAMKMASLLGPVLRFYQYVLYPVAKPSAWALDQWLGRESIEYLRERQLKGMIEQHIESDHAEIDYVEGRGALNFLEIDDVPIDSEGETIHPDSIIKLPTTVDLPRLPEVKSISDPFVQAVNASDQKWVVFVDLSGTPRLVLDADAYLRAIMFEGDAVDGYRFCHRPIVIRDPKLPLGDVFIRLRDGMSEDTDEVIDRDIVLLWNEQTRRIITGADLLGRLLRGI